MSILKKLAGETAIYGMSSILGRLINWVVMTPYLTRVFANGEYGIVSDLYTYIALLLVLFTYRMETALFRYGRDAANRDQVFTTAALSIVATTVLFTGLLLWQAPALAAWLQYPGQAEYVMLFGLIVAFDALAAIPFARLRLLGRPVQFAVIKVASIGVNILLVFFFLEVCPALEARGWHWADVLYHPDRRISYLFWANLLASITTLVALAWSTPRTRLVFDPAIWQKMLRYSLPLVLAGVAGVVNQLIGVPLLKIWASPDLDYNLGQAGIYAAAARLAVLMNLFIQAFNYAAEPFFFKHAAESDDKTVYAHVARAFALVGSLALVGIMLYLDLIQYFLGRDFREGLGVLPILLVANFFLGLYFNFAMSYKLTDQTRLGGYIALGGAAITLALNWWLIPRVGYYGPAWASLGCYGFMAAASYYAGRRLLPVVYPFARMAAYLLGALALYGASELARPWLPPGLGITLAFNTALLAPTLWWLWRSERTWLRSVLGR